MGDESVETSLDVDPEGRRRRAGGDRWFEAAGPGYDLFAVEFRGELRADGYTIPATVTAGRRLGEDDEVRSFRTILERALFR